MTYEAKVEGDREYSRVHGLFVGVNRYHHLGGRRSLEGAVNDALALSEALRPALSTEPVVLTDADASRRNILVAIERLMRESLDGDLVVFFCACHGDTKYGEFFLWPFDFDQRRFLATALPFRDVANAMGKPNVDTLAIIDACHAGAIGFDPKDLYQGQRSSVMLAAEPLETSKEFWFFEGGKQKRGVFTYGLVQQLASAFAEERSISEVFRRAYHYTKERTRNAQHPLMVGTLPADLKIRLRNPPAPQ